MVSVACLKRFYIFIFTAIPQKIGKKYWPDGLALPQGRDEKENNQANTQPI
jgi:hypothetical protein